MTVAVPDFFAHTPARLAGAVLDCPPTAPIPAARVGADDGPLDMLYEKGPEPRFVPARESRTAHPGSPVGRTCARLADTGPAARSPIHRLEERLGRPLVDMGSLSDVELHAITDLILTEKHRRAARWLNLAG